MLAARGPTPSFAFLPFALCFAASSLSPRVHFSNTLIAHKDRTAPCKRSFLRGLRSFIIEYGPPIHARTYCKLSRLLPNPGSLALYSVLRPGAPQKSPLKRRAPTSLPCTGCVGQRRQRPAASSRFALSSSSSSSTSSLHPPPPRAAAAGVEWTPPARAILSFASTNLKCAARATQRTRQARTVPQSIDCFAHHGPRFTRTRFAQQGETARIGRAAASVCLCVCLCVHYTAGGSRRR